MNKLFLIALFSIILISLSSAATLGTYGVNQCINLKQTCDNCTYVNITSVNAVTNQGASVQILGNVPMTKSGTEYNYTFCSTGYVGEYTYITVGNPDGETATESVSFIVGGNSIILLIIIFVLIYAIAFAGFFGKNEWIAILGGLAMIALGIYITRNGIDIYRNFITDVVAVVTIAIGAIFSLTAGIAIVEENL